MKPRSALSLLAKRRTKRQIILDGNKWDQAMANMAGVPAKHQQAVPELKQRAPRVPSLIPTEHQEQCAVVEWWGQQCKAWNLPRKALFAIPNAQALIKFADNPNAYITYMRMEGFRDGMLDLMLAVPSRGFHGLFLELKRSVGGVTSKEQAEYVLMFESLEYQARIAVGADFAIGIIKTYLGKN